MRFPSFKPFQGGIADVVGWLKFDLVTLLREVSAGLSRLTFSENFQSFQVEVTIASGAEAEIRNQIRGAAPTKWIVVRAQTSWGDLTDGDTAWTQDYVYLKNQGATSITVTVLFLA